MRQVLSDLLHRFLSESGLNLEDFVWGTLFVCLFCSTTHLVSMLVTRWGDHSASAKALIFSILLYTSGVMALCAVSLKASQSLQKGEQTLIPIRKVVLDNKDQALSRKQDGEDNPTTAPVWDRLPPTLSPGSVRGEPGQREFFRGNVANPEAMPSESPERQDVAIERSAPKLPDLPSRPDAPIDVPTTVSAPADVVVANKLAAAPMGAVTLPDPDTAVNAEARGEGTPAAGISRMQPTRGGDSGIASPTGEKLPSNSIERVEKPISPDRILASIGGRTDPGASLPKPAPVPMSIGDSPAGTPRPSPAPITLEGESGGTPAAESGAGTGAVAGSPTAIRRKVNRIGDGAGGSDSLSGAGTERGAPGVPGSTGTAPDRALAIRDSISGSNSRTGSLPGIERPDASPLAVRGGAGVPSTYRLRTLDKRREVARKYGGTEASEKAVENSLKWFASIQEPDGSWDGDRYGAGQVKLDEKGVDREYAGKDSDTGLTALVILSFLGAGYTQEEGPYASQVDRALRWLISQQRDDGYLGGKATHYAQMYCHGMATYALAEACGMQSDPAADTGLREPLRKAVLYILDSQNSNDGGWRYIKGQKSDMSMFGWQLMALKSAEIAGLRIPDDARARMVGFLKERSLGTRSGLAGYRAESPASPSMTAEALFCKQMLGISRSNPQSREAVEYLLARLPRRTEMDEYYWYYGTLAMYQYGGEAWDQWNASIRELLISDQVGSGANAGSWEPRGVWGRYGGRIYQTALSTLCLEVYYRFLPLYQLNESQP